MMRISPTSCIRGSIWGYRIIPVKASKERIWEGRAREKEGEEEEEKGEEEEEEEEKEIQGIDLYDFGG